MPTSQRWHERPWEREQALAGTGLRRVSASAHNGASDLSSGLDYSQLRQQHAVHGCMRNASSARAGAQFSTAGPHARNPTRTIPVAGSSWVPLRPWYHRVGVRAVLKRAIAKLVRHAREFKSPLELPRGDLLLAAILAATSCPSVCMRSGPSLLFVSRPGSWGPRECVKLRC
jgi:hypothetical protein